ncbi:MAG TPA: hypothetical protein VHW00_13465 [Thermoanaerobaculia bacterium]|nr:hypothetical protein [Thermoanaerobaculia bacterium]
MSAHLTKAVCFALVLFVACGEDAPPDPYTTEAIQRDIEERPVKVLYEELDKLPPWTPPLRGTVSDWQVESFINVSRLSRRIIEVSSGEFDEKVENAHRDDDRYSRMATAFSALGNARNAATAEIRASLRLNVHPREYDWVAQQIRRGAETASRQRVLQKKIRDAEQARNAEYNEYLRAQRETELAEARRELQYLLDGLGDAERANAEKVLQHAGTLAPYVASLRRK